MTEFQGSNHCVVPWELGITVFDQCYIPLGWLFCELLRIMPVFVRSVYRCVGFAQSATPCSEKIESSTVSRGLRNI